MNVIDSGPFAFSKILDAAKKCFLGVRWKNPVAKWELNLLDFSAKLQDELIRGKYRMADPVVFTVTSPKPRKVNSLAFRDRVVHQMLCMNGVYDDFTRGNFYDNGACQVGKGTKFAVDRFRCMMERHYRKYGANGYFVSFDIRKFFNSIPKDKLIEFVRKKVSVKEYVPIIEELIMSSTTGTDELHGIDLGSQIDQIMAGAYLTTVDHEIKMNMKVRGYVRYMDNFIALIPPYVDVEGVTVDGKEYSKTLFRNVDEVVRSIGLTLNPKSRIIPMDEGVEFCGFRFKYGKNGRILMLTIKSKLVSSKRRIRRQMRLLRSGSDSINSGKIGCSLSSWISHIRKASNFRSAVRQMKEQIRKVINETDTAAGDGRRPEDGFRKR